MALTTSFVPQLGDVVTKIHVADSFDHAWIYFNGDNKSVQSISHLSIGTEERIRIIDTYKKEDYGYSLVKEGIEKDFRSMSNNKVNLCDTCVGDFPECRSESIIFGDDIGNDNICACSLYKIIF